MPNLYSLKQKGNANAINKTPHNVYVYGYVFALRNSVDIFGELNNPNIFRPSGIYG